MNLLKRVLYLEAALWALEGALLGVLPHFVLVTIARLGPYPEYAWVRVAGIQAVAMAMLMVLVANRSKDVWWWSWAFVFETGAIAAFAVLKAALRMGQGPWAFWWLSTAVAALFTAALLWGIVRTGRETPVA